MQNTVPEIVVPEHRGPIRMVASTIILSAGTSLSLNIILGHIMEDIIFPISFITFKVMSEAFMSVILC